MSLQIKGKPQPWVTLVSVLAIGIIIGLSVRSIGYFWVMLVPNIFLLVLTIFLLIAYFERPERTARQPAHYPSLSVIIPSYNSKSTIFRTIDTIRASDYPGEKEIIVVDDGSSDGSRELLAKTEGIRVILQEKNGGKAKALNTAIPHTKGEFVACVDSDSYPEPDVFRHMADTLMHDDRNGAVTCFIRVEKPRSLLEKLQDMEYLTGFGFVQMATRSMNIIFVTPGPCTLFRKKTLVEIGGFDEENITEDLEIAWRLRKYDYKIEYTSDAVVYTDVPNDLKSLFYQRLRWYRGKIFNLRKHPDMLFNRKYGLFSTFMLPASFTAELAGVVLSFSFVYLLINQGIWFAKYIGSNLALGASLLSSTGMLIVGMSALAMGLIMISPWVFVLILSHVMAGRKVRLADVPLIVVFLFLYGAMITSFYCLSIIYEVNRSDYRWK